MSFPPFVNLSSLAEQLEKTGKDRQLRMALKQAWRAQSCLGDLTQAKDSCSVLRNIIGRPRKSDTPELLTTERALLTMAVILYARATSTSGQKGERGSIQLDRSKLTKEQWADHQSLLDVRNQALAHVYSSQEVGSYLWHRELLFAVELKAGRWKTASATNQVSFHAATLERLERMLPIAHELIMERFQKRMLAISARLNEGGVQQSMMLAHQFDPVRAFGSEQAVRRLLTGATQKEDAFWVNE